MELKDIKMYDLDKLYKMYKEFEEYNWVTDKDTDEFLELYVRRCECCNEICWKDELAKRNCNGIDAICCKKCQEVIDSWSNEHNDIDYYDVYKLERSELNANN